MDDLLALISTLSSTEKQHFKKRHSQNTDFVLLFDFLNKRKSCSNTEALSHLSKKTGYKKKYSSSYLSVVKTYLKNRILESLRIQFIHKRKNYELMSRSMNTDILLEKGLYTLAKNEITLSNNKNLESSFPIERLLLLRRQSLLDYFENYNNTSLQEINSLFEARLNTAEQLIMEIKFARILSILSFQYFNGLNDIELLKSFMAEPYMQDESLATDFSTQYLFHWVHAQFQEFKNNNEEALIHFNKSIKIWIDNPTYIEAHPRMYLGACFTYFKYLIHQKEPFSNILDDINFDFLMSKIEAGSLSTEEKEKYTFLFNLFEILTLRMQNKSDEIIEIATTYLQDENYINELPDFEKVIFHYYSAQAYFVDGNYKKAEDILFDLLSPLDKRLASNPVYISVYLLLHIVILLECNNVKHLKSVIPRYKKFLKQEERMTIFEIHFFSMVTQLISPRFEFSHETVYDRFYIRLRQAQEEDNRGIKLEYDYIVSWVKKRIELL